VSREPGQGRRDLRRHTKPGALKKSHAKGGCGKTTGTMLLVVLVLVGACVVSVVDWLG